MQSLPDLPKPNDWHELVVKMGHLTLATGYLENAIIVMVARTKGEPEEKYREKEWSNYKLCKELGKIAPAFCKSTQKDDLIALLGKIRKLYTQRNNLIHAALVVVSDDSILGVPPGSIIDFRTYGLGFTEEEGRRYAVGMMGKRINLDEIERLTDAIHEARVGLSPFMELVDQIEHPARPFPTPQVGKLLKNCR